MPKSLFVFKRLLGRSVQPFKELRLGLKRLPQFMRDWKTFNTLARATKERFPLRITDTYVCLTDATEATTFDPHYFYHTAWAARIIAETKPTRHVDVSSILYFPGIVSAFVPVDFYDIRPAPLRISNLGSKQGDLTKLPFPDNSVSSLSSLHVVEHVGLGRYGDPLDYDGDLKAMHELSRVLAPSGSLLFVVPVGQPRIQWNAHRIYSYEQVIGAFPQLKLKEFALVTDNDWLTLGLIRNADPALVAQQRYACGCFWFVKP